MLRSIMSLVLATYILGPVWSVVAALLLVAGGVGLLHGAWHLLLIATAP